MILDLELKIYLKTRDHIKKCALASAKKIGINSAGRRELRTRRDKEKSKFQLNSTFKSYTAGVLWHEKMDRQLSEISHCNPSRRSETETMVRFIDNCWFVCREISYLRIFHVFLGDFEQIIMLRQACDNMAKYTECVIDEEGAIYMKRE